MPEQEFHFDEEKKSSTGGIGRFIWNSQTKEFCGRSGSSWAKVSFFYSIFYACLGAFFIGMLAVFFQIMPTDKPTYFGESSTMAQKGLNPGLGFRPQIDVEDNLINFNPSVYDAANGHKAYVENLKIFLQSKYAPVEADVLQCTDGMDYTADLMSGKSCKFDYAKIFEGTNCTEENSFGYNSNRLCVLVKLNKIVSWKPEGDAKRIKITCEGETSVDVDNLKSIKYHSENNLNSEEGGFLDAKYFPYYSQASYRAPFVFVEFNMDPNVLVSVRCVADAANIDHEDRVNMRGMTKFSIFVSNKKNN